MLVDFELPLQLNDQCQIEAGLWEIRLQAQRFGIGGDGLRVAHQARLGVADVKVGGRMLRDRAIGHAREAGQSVVEFGRLIRRQTFPVGIAEMLGRQRQLVLLEIPAALLIRSEKHIGQPACVCLFGRQTETCSQK